MSLYERVVKKEERIAVVGLGYVGLPLLYAFSKRTDVIGYDVNSKKIELYRNGVDQTGELPDGALKDSNIIFTNDEKCIGSAKFIIVAVPTPVKDDNSPDLTPLISASETVGRNLSKGSIIVYESTVYPGCTEEVCIPVLEEKSGLKCGIDFKVGYSPERINPGDKVHHLENIRKIVSGMDDESCKEIENIYNLIIEVGTYPVSSIKTAEAIKVLENSQRDINIAFMNEAALIFNRMGIDTSEVVCGMNTKWNALGFRPGLVGGHCIGVDPYYLVHKAKELGIETKVISSGRAVNDSMGFYVAEKAIEKMEEAGLNLKEAKVSVLGLTFKENCGDLRNSKVYDTIKELRSHNIEPIVVDPYADKDIAFDAYKVTLKSIDDAKDSDCIIIAVAHNEFRKMGLDKIKALFREKEDSKKILLDVKSIYELSDLKKSGISYWRL